MSNDVVYSFYFRGEEFIVVLRGDFEATQGEEGWIELQIADQKKYGVFKLFDFYLNGAQLVMWVRVQVQGQIFTRAFIDRCFEVVRMYLEQQFGLTELVEEIGIRLTRLTPLEGRFIRASELHEARLMESVPIHVLF